ncbi:hypothetical protein SaccyDRAFT_0720, partial [Saccharomonospora cyanea NA-134]
RRVLSDRALAARLAEDGVRRAAEFTWASAAEAVWASHAT